MKLLLVPEQKITAGKASCAFWALEWLLLRMGALMSLQMLKSRKGALAGTADMRSRLIGLWWWEVVHSLVGSAGWVDSTVGGGGVGSIG